MTMTRAVPFLILVSFALAAVFVPEAAPAKPGGPVDSGDTAWLLTATCLVLLMTPGLSFFYGGMVSRKNVISTMLQSFVALGVVSLIWVAFGFSLAFGESYVGRCGGACGRHVPGSAPGTSGRPCTRRVKHSVRAARHRDAVVRLVRI